MKKLLTLLILTFYASSIFAQIFTLNHGKIKQKHYLQEIPYQKKREGLIVPVTINGKEYKFIFDTGAPLIISDKIYKELNLRTIRLKNMGDASGENKKQVRFILLPEIDIQGITFLNTPGAVFYENSGISELAECFGVDGIIGSNMLRNSVVQFDEQNKQIIITDNIKKLSLQTHKYQKMKLSFMQSNPYITITLPQSGTDHNVLFDTGDAGSFFTLSLNRLNSCVVDTIAENEGSFGIGVHGFFKKQKHLLLNIPELVINGTTFSDVTVSTTHTHCSIIGSKLLQYGKTTLDYKKKRFYFEPYDHINTSKPAGDFYYPINFTFQNDKKVVGIIWDKTLEDEINLGDEVLSVNGIYIQEMDFCEKFMLKFPPSDKYIFELRDIHTGAIKKVEIERIQVNKDKKN
jgi:hypothetical protein